jgi:hypothetical protein
MELLDFTLLELLPFEDELDLSLSKMLLPLEDENRSPNKPAKGLSSESTPCPLPQAVTITEVKMSVAQI